MTKTLWKIKLFIFRKAGIRILRQTNCMAVICKNCEIEYSQVYNFCPNCSQKSVLHRLTFHDIIHEGIHYFTHADKGLFQLIRDLFIKRGLVAFEYIEGKRKKYFPPLNFFLMIAAVFVFVATQTEEPLPTNILKVHPEINQISDPAEKEQAISIYERKIKVTHFTTRYSNLMAMCSLPLTALVFWLFYKKAKYNYIEHLVAGMYMLGFCILIYSLLIIPVGYIFDVENYVETLLFFLVQFLYFAVFYYGFMRKTTKMQFAKVLGVSFLNLIVWFVLSASVVRFYIVSGFGGLLE